MRRAILLSLATALGFALGGCAVGAALGVVAPELYRRGFQVAAGEAFDPVRLGLGSGAIVGFLSGAVVAAVGLAAGVLPGLGRQRLFAERSFQPTFAGLLVLVAVLALGLASLKSPSQIGVELWFGFTALALASATLVALGQPAGRRGFAAGFAVLGWSYLILSLHTEPRKQLPTSRVLAMLEKRISGSWRVGVQSLSLEMGPFPARRRGASWEPIVTSHGGIPGTLDIDEVQPEFRRIGHSLCALLLGVVGGILCDLRLTRRLGGPRPDATALGVAIPPLDDLG